MSFFTLKSENSNYYDSARLNITWKLNLILILFLPPLAIVLYDLGEKAATPTLIGFIFCFALMFVMKKSRQYRLTATVHSLLGSILCIYVLVFISDSYHFVDVVWMLIIILHTYFTLGRKWGTGILLFSLVGALYYILFGLQFNLDQVNELDQNQIIALAINFSICMAIIGYYVNQFLKVNKYAESKYIELTKTLQDKNEEKTILLKEIHHRVKNNLQVITSLLRLQSKDITDGKYLAMYEESINRVAAMSLMHDRIIQNPDLTNIDFENYIESLVHDLVKSNSLNTKIELKISSTVNKISAKSLVPMALIFNELITNSIKHGFKEKSTGEIGVSFDQNEDFILINFSDNGTWINSHTEHGLGLDLINSLTNQLNGEVQRIISEERTEYQFKFGLSEFENED